MTRDASQPSSHGHSPDTRPWLDHLWGLLLAISVTLVLSSSARNVAYVRDEGIYFEASRHYAAWLASVLESPSKIAQQKSRDRAFRINSEHPALLKTLAGSSALLWARAPEPEAVAEDYRGRPYDKGKIPRRELASGGVWPVMSEGAAMRLPAQIIAGLGVWLLFVAGRRWAGYAAGLFASLSFVTLPRVAYHASLHCFDVAAAVAWLAVVLTYRRALRDPRWGLALGPVLGLAIALKHNALFMGFLLIFSHYYAMTAWTALRRRIKSEPGLHWARIAPWPIVSTTVLAPVTAWLLWPWLWHDPLERLTRYIQFHTQHSYYNMEYLGQNYNLPPLPLSYATLMTVATTPGIWLLCGLLGLSAVVLSGVRRSFGQGAQPAATKGRRDGFFRPMHEEVDDTWCARSAVGIDAASAWLLLMATAMPIAVISLPWVPIFGGTKHWLASYPLLALMGGFILGRAFHALGDHRESHALARWFVRSRLNQACIQCPVLILCLAPGVWATVHSHPWGLSQYTAFVGGPRGAAQLGLNRGFWGGNGSLALMRAHGSTRLRVHVHDMHQLALRQYRREGRWPKAWNTSSLSRANAALLFHERHMMFDETRIWNEFSTTQPLDTVILDDVPLTSFYREP